MGMKSFETKRIIVTGAASGIGKELVRLLYPLTKRILAVDISTSDLDHLKSEFPELAGFLSVDLSKKEGTTQILNWVKKEWNGVDICFANAGKAEYNAAAKQNFKQLDSLFQLNVFSPIQLGTELKTHYSNPNFRHVITCSAIAFWAIPGYSNYGASKAALLQWARTIWAEKTGDWLTLVFPIATSTNFFDAAGRSIPKAFPIQKPEFVARKILSGAERGKKKIFPSLLFKVMLRLNNFLPFIQEISQRIELKKFRSWAHKQTENSQN